ncbi:MAG: bifunctional nuclease family protein [Deltaproteobacteria bacterium]|nr:bifunctional nuclease family protein [Deltaproteobacteria bacterium]MBW2051681.1 bifunctional nuclease family protein [Deltaproteobacteria bacterium]MBW2140203.1 bifunctional nuclease family protein [Deltaproteobacteria bacterium]MBW2323909.1 bifunctional nuclease family protein [Deltaproteobacteria bacterium]
MSIRVTVTGLTIDPATNSPIMILKEEEGDQTLPIWIGLLEATAIASELEQVKFSRPMTHDLLHNVIETFGGSVEMVEICDLKDNTFFATVYALCNSKKFQIDARPSDAIALALRTKSPIFVHEKVFEKSAHMDMRGKEAVKTDDAKKWTEVLENLRPEDFGKYKM